MPYPFDAQHPYLLPFRGRPSGAVPASQPASLRLRRASNVMRRIAPRVWPFASVRPLLWPRLTSVRASSASGDAASCVARKQISQGKARDRRSIHPPHIRRTSPDDIGLRVFVPSRPPARRLVCGSCSSGRSFACGFLPTSPHGDAVAVRLGVPVIETPRGLAPPSHFPTRFRYRLTAPATALRAMPGAHTKTARPEQVAPCFAGDPAEAGLYFVTASPVIMLSGIA